MKNSAESKVPEWVQSLLESPLVLPEDDTFHSVPAQVSFEQILALSEKYLPVVNSRPDFVEMKLARQFNEPFVLF